MGDSMFDHKHYVPILKGKEGEYSAVERLYPNVKSNLTPLIEIPPIPWDYVNECEGRTLDEHIGRVAGRVERCWGIERPLFLDLDSDLWPERTQGGNHPLTFILEDARNRGVKIIPVTGLRRDGDYQSAVLGAIQNDKLGVCIRLEGNDFEELPQFSSSLNDLVASLSLSSNELDIVLDFEAILPTQNSTVALAAISIINALPDIDNWRTLTFTASAFPEDLRAFAPASIGTTQRSEWLVWQLLIQRRTQIPRLPTFGDYAIANPELIEIDPRIMKMSANLRYTIDSDWLIFKERDVKHYGYDQFSAICSALIARPEYAGANFSWGDDYISKCASGSEGSGNATTWRRIGTNHHLTLVVQQISNYPVP